MVCFDLKNLNKSENSLTPSEILLIEQHPYVGSLYVKEILKKHNCPNIEIEQITNGIRFHHHPANSTEKEFVEPPTIAKIVSMFDIFTALTEHRPFRTPGIERNNAFSYDQALLVMGGMRNQFDPKLFQQFRQFVLNNLNKQTTQLL